MASSSTHMETDQETQPISQGSAFDAQSTTDPRLRITFNSTGQIIGNKVEFKARCLTLLKIQVGLEYDNWAMVDQAIKDDMWKILCKEFIVPVDRKEDVMKEMSVQLRTWRFNTRQKYLKGLDATEILKLKDNMPEKEKFRLSQWNAFIEIEASAKKLEQRKILKANRAMKTDVHCLGRTSYAEKAIDMKAKDPQKRSPTRSELYVEARKQPKTGEFHPKVADKCNKVKDLASSQDSSHYTPLESDAVTQICGKDTRGTTRGVGRVCKGKVKSTKPLKTEMEEVIDSNKKMEKKMDTMFGGLQNQIAGLVKAFSMHQKLDVPEPSPPPQYSTPEFSPQSSRGGFIASPSPCQLSTPSPIPSPTKTHVLVRDVVTNNVIAKGYVIPTRIGEQIHGRKMLGHEAKVEITNVENDAFEAPLYLGGNSFASTIGEVIGGFVVWPKCFIEEVKE